LLERIGYVLDIERGDVRQFVLQFLHPATRGPLSMPAGAVWSNYLQRSRPARGAVEKSSEHPPDRGRAIAAAGFASQVDFEAFGE
jgi:hypothetical protein